MKFVDQNMKVKMVTMMKGDEMSYSFCESVQAVPMGKWHIRKLTKVGKKLSGGADTESLCGRKMAWDIDVEISKFHLENSACEFCRKYLRDLQKEEQK